MEIALASQIVLAVATVVHVAASNSAMIEVGLAFEQIPPLDRETLAALGFGR